MEKVLERLEDSGIGLSPSGGALEPASQPMDWSQQQLVPAVAHPVELLSEAAAADDSSVPASYSRHVHVHMHMHAAPVHSAAMCSMNVAIANNQPSQTQQHHMATQQPWTTAQSPNLGVDLHSTHQQQQQQQDLQTPHQKLQKKSKQAHHSPGLDAEPTILQLRQQHRRSRLRQVLRTMAITGAATAVALAGAGLAAAALAPRMEQLESSYHEVRKQQEELQQHATQLANAKEQLQQQLSELLTQQDTLSQHKQQLQQQVQRLQEQQTQHDGNNLLLQERIQQLQDSQQQLQETSAQLTAQVNAAKAELLQEPTTASSATAMQRAQQSNQQQQHPQQWQQDDSAGIGATGDLKLQLTVPGFTDALVHRIGEAELVPKFAEALVNQVKETSLVQHTVEGLAARVGQQVAAVVCPWKWQLPFMPGRQGQGNTAAAAAAAPDQSGP